MTADQRIDEAPSNPLKVQQQPTSFYLRAMAQRERTEGRMKMELADVLDAAADTCDQMEVKPHE